MIGQKISSRKRTRPTKPSNNKQKVPKCQQKQSKGRSIFFPSFSFCAHRFVCRPANYNQLQQGIPQEKKKGKTILNKKKT